MAYHERDLASEIEALRTRFLDKEFSETVFRASLHCKGLRGDELNQIVRDTIILMERP
jgi:hypothetical protein